MARLGWHWMGRGSGVDPARLADAAVARALLDAWVEALGLRAIRPAQVHAEPDGVVGVVLLAESHASVHTAPDDGAVYVDLFSCVPFAAPAVGPVVRDLYAPSSLTAHLLDRGPDGAHPAPLPAGPPALAPGPSLAGHRLVPRAEGPDWAVLDGPGPGGPGCVVLRGGRVVKASGWPDPVARALASVARGASSAVVAGDPLGRVLARVLAGPGVKAVRWEDPDPTSTAAWRTQIGRAHV